MIPYPFEFLIQNYFDLNSFLEFEIDSKRLVDDSLVQIVIIGFGYRMVGTLKNYEIHYQTYLMSQNSIKIREDKLEPQEVEPNPRTETNSTLDTTIKASQKTDRRRNMRKWKKTRYIKDAAEVAQIPRLHKKRRNSERR